MPKKYAVAALRARIGESFGSISPVHRDSGHYYRLDSTGRETASVTTKIGAIGAKPYLKQWAVNKAVEHIERNLPRLSSGDIVSVFDEARIAHKEALDLAGRTGTSAHEAIDKYITAWIETGNRDTSAVKFLDDGAPNTQIASCRSFDKFLEEDEIIPIASEIKVWYEQGRDCFAGTVDFIFLRLEVYKERRGQEGIVDPNGKAHTSHDYEVQEKGVFWCSACGREATAKLILGDHKTSNSVKGKDDYAQQSVAYAKGIEKATGWKFDDIWVMRYSKERAEYEVVRVTDRKQAWKEFLAISRTFDILGLRGDGSLLGPLKTKQIIKI